MDSKGDNTVNAIKQENIEKSEFSYIQCGVFGDANNANILKETIKKVLPAFVIEEDNKFKVVAGLYVKGESEKYSDLLTVGGIENIKNYIAIDKKNNCDTQILEIINGNLKLLQCFCDNKVKSVKTSEFKSWLNELPQVEQKSANIKLLEEIKKFSTDLPDELTTENVEKNYLYLYKLVIDMSKSK
jgi:hypothetical protein